MSAESCKCSTVWLGMKPVGKNWNPDCPVHPWDDRLQAQADKAVEMQRKAAEARRRARSGDDPTYKEWTP